MLNGVGSNVVGSFVGLGLGIVEGLREGLLVVGNFVGLGVGKDDGIGLGDGVGIDDGIGEGADVGRSVGEGEGLRVGVLVGVGLGFGVGLLVGSSEYIQFTVIFCFLICTKLAPLKTSHSSSSPRIGSFPASVCSMR